MCGLVPSSNNNNFIDCFVYSMSEKHSILERVRIREVYPFSWRVFFTWDFSVTSRSGVITKHKVLIRELKVHYNVYAYYMGEYPFV